MQPHQVRSKKMATIIICNHEMDTLSINMSNFIVSRKCPNIPVLIEVIFISGAIVVTTEQNRR